MKLTFPNAIELEVWLITNIRNSYKRALLYVDGINNHFTIILNDETPEDIKSLFEKEIMCSENGYDSHFIYLN